MSKVLRKAAVRSVAAKRGTVGNGREQIVADIYGDDVFNIKTMKDYLPQPTYRKLLAKRWYWNVLLGYEKNDELGVNDRWSLGGGVGQFLLRSNVFELMWVGGLVASREFSTDSVNNQVEFYAGGRFAWFQHRFPKTDIRTDVLVFPSVTEGGRVRTSARRASAWKSPTFLRLSPSTASSTALAAVNS